MHIGIDFDNTIVNYDKLFFSLALEKNLIPHDLAIDRLIVRDYLRRINQEDQWTQLQGEVYGAHMLDADPYPNIINFIQQTKNAGHTISIVSHKTQYPYAGPRYNLHKSARSWIDRYLIVNDTALFADTHIFFELTKDAKLNRIAQINCDIFIDDLPEILLAPNFPTQVQRFLFDPKKHHCAQPLANIQVITSWKNMEIPNDE